MNETHPLEEVISAFLDDEPFDARELAQALGEPGGRELLIDLVALRHLALAEDRTVAVAAPTPRRVLPALAAAAAVLVALVGGYMAGERRSQAAALDPPAATRVVEAPAGWQVIPPGRMQ